jgi:hypothetical protein
MRRPLAWTCASALAVASCGDAAAPAAPRAAVLVSVRTNLGVTRDLDSLRITVQQDGVNGAFHDRLYSLGADGYRLPAALAIVPGERKDSQVTITVEGTLRGDTVTRWHAEVFIPENWEEELQANLDTWRQNNQPVDGPKVQAEGSVPSADRPVEPALARLDMQLDALCTMEAVGRCLADETCVRGDCIESYRELGELPLATKADAAPVEGEACFDPFECLAGAVRLPRETASCSFEAPPGDGPLNLGVEVSAGTMGFCDADRCVLPLDAGEELDFVEGSDGTLLLAAQWCSLLDEGRVLSVVGIRELRDGCTTKRPSDPLCPVDGVAAGGGAGGAPPAAAGGAGAGGAGSDGGLLDAPTFSEIEPYVVPLVNDVVVRSLLTVGESASNAPDGDPYALPLAPHGLGLYDEGGTWRLLVTHRLEGASVSSWSFDDLMLQNGEQLVASQPGKIALVRLGAAHLATALSDPVSGNGYSSPLLLAAQEGLEDARGYAFDLAGNATPLTDLGRFAWGGIAAGPQAEGETLVAYTERAPGGHVFLHAGPKGSMGASIERAGLASGALYAVRINPDGSQTFVLVNVSKTDPVSVGQDASIFALPGGVAWDPSRPGDLYFVSSGLSSSEPSELWRLRFKDLTELTAGGSAEKLLDGSQGEMSMDGITIDGKGHVYLLERPGQDAHLARIMRYDIATSQLVFIAQADPASFEPSSPTFVSSSEELAAIVDASHVLAPGWFIVSFQVADGTGQLLALFDPSAR